MNQLFAERFKSARLMNGFSLQDLSDKLGNSISKQALHKYEKGEVLPDSEKMELLCNVFGLRPDYFTRETVINLDEIQFRKLEKFPKKEQYSIIERTKEMLSRYLELEEILGIKEPFKHPAPEFTEINSMEDVEKFALKVRKEWKIGTNPISNVPELLEENNIKVIEFNTEDGFDGMQTWVNDKEIPVIALNVSKITSDDRKRFTALHELGHLLLPLDGVEYKLAEKYCNRFAGAMLFPEEVVKHEFGEKRKKISINELGIVKKQYGISIQALVYRLKDLEIISLHYMSYYFKYINEMGWKREEPFEYKGKEKSDRFDQLIYRALFEDIISMSKAASYKNMKLSEFRTKFLSVE